MNIMLDNIIFDLQRTGGISVYWRELASRIQENFKDSCHRVSSLSESLLPLAMKRMLPVRGNPFKGRPFIFHSSYYRINRDPQAVNIVTVHDFTHRKFGRGLRNRFFLGQQTYAIKNAGRIICVSNSTKRDLLSFFPEINPQIIDVIYNGVADVFLRCPERAKNRQRDNRPYALFVGSRALYKNFDNAVLGLKACEINLVIAGSEPLSRYEIDFLDQNLKNRWEFVQSPSDHTLADLYSQCVCLLYPSSYEGFGIPILEAAACGVPAVACRNSSIPEVSGPSTYLIDRPLPSEITAAVTAISSGAWTPDISGGIEHSKAFTWDKCYRQTIDGYNQAINPQRS